MRKAISILACIGWLLSTMTFGFGLQTRSNQPAQPRPDLSGKWILDLGKSKLGRERAPLKITSVTLLISHQEPMLRLNETTDYDGLELTEEMICYTDGRGEINRTPIRSMAMKSLTRWKGTQLLTKSSIDSTFPSSEVRVGRDSSYGGTGMVTPDKHFSV